MKNSNKQKFIKKEILDKATIFNGDNMEILKSLPDNSIDSIVTDPPYGLSFMGKKWDHDVPNVEFWKEVYRVLKPGGHVLSFGGTRTYHRMVVNIEDAGFEIRDQIMWIYGSGFPKSHNIGKAIDKFGGNNLLDKEIGNALKQVRLNRGISLKQADKLFCDGTSNYSWFEGRKNGQRIPNQETFDKIVNEWPELQELRNKVRESQRECLSIETTNKTVMQKIGENNETGMYHRTKGNSNFEGWGTGLKPANEPICVARKPISEKTIASNVIKWGTGGLNIEESKIGNDLKSAQGFGDTRFVANNSFCQTEFQGRFPSNVIMDEFSGNELDKIVGEISKGHWSKSKTTGYGNFGKGNSIYSGQGHKDESKLGPSKFFYSPKVSKKERNIGLEDKENQKIEGRDGGQDNRNVPFKNRTIERKNIHPTVKPVDLMRYLIKLVTPKNGIVMDPFMGSGSTGIGALIEGFNFVGMEMDPGYFEIAKQRIDHSDQYMELLDSKKKTIIKKETKKAKCKVSQEENQSIQIGIWANRNLKRIA